MLLLCHSYVWLVSVASACHSSFQYSPAGMVLVVELLGSA